MNLKGIMVLTLFLIGMLTLAFNIQPVKASGTIYIRADGSVYPPTANITSLDNATYTFTGNINGPIIVGRSNIIIDGAGFTLQGVGSGIGILLSSVSNVTVKNTNVEGFEQGICFNSISYSVIGGNNITANWGYGIYFLYSSKNSITGNNIRNNLYGVHYVDSSDNIISRNNITNNRHYGAFLEYNSSFNTISMNNVTNNGYYFLYGRGIYLSCSGGNIVSRNSVINNKGGIEQDHGDNNIITENTLKANEANGISLLDSSLFNTIFRNNVTNNGWSGLSMLYSYGNIISRNTATNNAMDGIHLGNSSGNIMSGNTATNNGIGISLYASNGNNITENTLANNQYGMFLKPVLGIPCNNNTIYHNNFINNTYQVSSKESVNTWDDGYPSGGNYWSNHICTGNPSNGSQPYIIDANNIDHYPFQDPNGWLPHGPRADFTYSPPSPATNEVVTFDASASLPGWNGTHIMSIVSYEWDFGDGNVTVTPDQIITHKYAVNKTYTVTLNVTDAQGWWNTTSKTITVHVHDVAVISVTPSATEVTIGESVNITVVVKNNGSVAETFNVTVYYNTTKIDTQTVTDLAAGATKTLNFTWDTSDVDAGNYTIKAVAEIVTGDTNTANNEKIAQVKVKEAVGPGGPLIPWLWIGIGVVVVVAIIAAAYMLRRKK